MNRRVIARTTAALCAELIASVPDAARRGLCVGFDGRHKSRDFADEVQAIANGAGFVVHAFEDPAPTPLLAFAVRDRGAAAGVMVTASHNPAAYNGYKVYWEDGAQLNTPYDERIAARIAEGPDSRALPRTSRAVAQTHGRWQSLADIPTAYFRALAARLQPAASGRAPKVAYTALHGVGEAYARTALQLAGVTELSSVHEQAAPDPDFPTVRFPNPEEPGALDRLLALARASNADLGLANDPDADRLAAAVVAGDGALRALSGNELGVLLCDYLLESAASGRDRFIVTTIVSTPLAKEIALAHGASAETTLTGFKWIVRRALERQAAGLHFVLGFEEALGYCVGDLVRDKDGIAAAAHVAQMAQRHNDRGQSLWQALEALYLRHGLWDSRQVSITLGGAGDAERMRAQLLRLRRQPPSALAGKRVSDFRDLLYGPNPDQLPPSDVIVLELEGGHRVTIRPSGTEPKLKLYLDCTERVASGQLDAARARLRVLGDALVEAVRALL
jgi:phosphomannomutase